MPVIRSLCILMALLIWNASPLLSQTGPTIPVASSSINGIITNASGTPLFGVNVALLAEDGGTVSDSTGRFALREIRPGGHTLLFRRIGYRSVERRLTLQAGSNTQIAVTMTAIPQQLARIVVEAPGVNRRRGTSSIGGTVADSAGHSVIGADVRLLGTGLSTMTDSSGTFQFQGLVAGSYIVRARQQGLLAGNAVMQIADEDNRDIQMKLYGLPAKTKPKDISSASGYGVADMAFAAFDRRVRSRMSTVLLGPADMFRADRASMDFVVRQYRELPGIRRRTGAANTGVGSTDDGDCLLIDGRRATYRLLSTYSSSNVMIAEVFRTGSQVDDFILSEMQSIRECRGDMSRHPSYFVLWTRALR